MEYNITDQLISGIQFSTTEWNFNPEILISEASIKTAIYGIYYKDGVLTVNQPLLMSSPSTPTEAYIDDNKILKLR